MVIFHCYFLSHFVSSAVSVACAHITDTDRSRERERDISLLMFQVCLSRCCVPKMSRITERILNPVISFYTLQLDERILNKDMLFYLFVVL